MKLERCGCVAEVEGESGPGSDWITASSTVPGVDSYDYASC